MELCWSLTKVLCVVLWVQMIECADSLVADEDTVMAEIDKLYENYNKNIRPPNGADPIDIAVDVYIVSLSAVSEKTMDYTVNMYIRQRWQDIRLALPNATEDTNVLINNKIPHIWLPDLFISNDKISKKSDITTLNAFLRVEKEGRLTYSVRVTSTIACSMHLARYPFDVQYCDMLFESYGHTTSELIFRWGKDKGQAVEVNEKIKLPEHVIGKEPATSICTVSYNTTGAFSCIAVQFVFTRNVNYHIMGMFLPSILIVLLSWVSFWIDKSSTPGRVSLSLLTILTMQNQMSSSLAQLPKVSYIKLVDVWLTGCLAFVFAGFLEYALVNKLAKKENEEKNRRRISAGLKTTLTGVSAVAADLLGSTTSITQVHSNGKNTYSIKKLNGSSSSDVESSIKTKRVETTVSSSEKVDNCSKWFFPLSFALFNLVLWLCYLIPDSKPHS